MAGRRDAGVTFLQDVLNRIPEDRRESLQAQIEANPELADLIGDGVLRQSEYSQIRDKQNQWWEENQLLSEIGRKAREAGFDPTRTTTPPTPAPVPTDVVSREEFERASRDVAGLVLDVSLLQAQHLHEFGEVVNLLDLAKDPRVPQIGLRGVYDQTVAPKRAEKAKTTLDAEVARRVDEEVKARLKSSANPNYPSAIPAGSPLDALVPINNNGASVDELTDMYNDLVAQGR